MKKLISSLTLLALAGLSASAQTDNFSVTHDYTTGVAGTIWNGFQVNGGSDVTQDTTVQAADANTTVSGMLSLNTTNGNWENGADDGAFLYLNYTGDFTAQVTLSAPYVDFNTAGIMARNASTVGGENWIASEILANFGLGPNQRNTINGGSGTQGSGNSFDNGVLQLVRSGNDFSSFYSGDGGATFSQVGTTQTRADLPGTLQVGLFQAAFSGNAATSTFDNFSIVPEPSSALLLGLGCLGFFTRRQKRSAGRIMG